VQSIGQVSLIGAWILAQASNGATEQTAERIASDLTLKFFAHHCNPQNAIAAKNDWS